MLKNLTAVLAFVCALLVAATAAATAAAVDFGANDDTGKYSADGGATFFGQMAATGLKQNVMTVRWSPSAPTTIPDKEFLDRAVPTAVAKGIKVLFAVYPYPPSQIESGGASPAAWSEWLANLANLYPQVTTYIVGNEPNLNSFWRPQGDGRGTILSGAGFGPFLAAGYDTLKARGATVLGVGSSPRGEKAPPQAGKTSPVHFLASLGAWYRASGRPAPLMDGFSFHPYPNPSDFTVPLSFAYGWPNASVQELPRIKQALHDAFAGTAQKTTATGLKLYLDEVGWQVSTEGNPVYTDSENVRVTSEENQAAIYDGLIRYVVCDPDVAQLNFFGYWDERSRSGWQSALRRADGSERASNAAVRAAIAATGGQCQGAMRSWTPLKTPDRASVTFGKATTSKAKARVSFQPSAAEDVTVKAGFVPASTAASAIPGLLASAGRVDANRRPTLSYSGTAAAGQVFAVALSATLAPDRVQVFTATAPAGKGAKPVKPGKSVKPGGKPVKPGTSAKPKKKP